MVRCTRGCVDLKILEKVTFIFKLAKNSNKTYAWDIHLFTNTTLKLSYIKRTINYEMVQIQCEFRVFSIYRWMESDFDLNRGLIFGGSFRNTE